ncbi:hypothetical protein EFP50_14120 [Lacticaseibacillus paracasei]|nr:hypothetical protein [Lacticaseibacillus paracasei]
MFKSQFDVTGIADRSRARSAIQNPQYRSFQNSRNGLPTWSIKKHQRNRRFYDRRFFREREPARVETGAYAALGVMVGF